MDGRTVRSTCFSVSFLTRRSSIHDQTAVRKRSVKLMTRTLSCSCSRARLQTSSTPPIASSQNNTTPTLVATPTMQRLNGAYEVLKAQVDA